MSDSLLLKDLVSKGMAEGMTLLDDMRVAEARLSRAQYELALAQEMAALTRERWEDNRTLVTDMWESLKVGLKDGAP